ncbi:YtxH domain-containing protein [Bacillus xiapuensis]|uniref:YtxH domain-containing protein n=1 Tax=Bacillus xiapuensis TaxID=2014075 RepID=UPI000C236CA7|nr:YtxH domain-containing protein [Bacillus xiapuensis]
MGKGKFFAGMAIGAVVGGLITLTDRQTRSEMKEYGKHVYHLAKNPQQIADSSKAVIEKSKEMFQQVNEDVGFIRDKVDSLMDLSPQVKDLVDETKAAFVPNMKKEDIASDHSAMNE